MEKHFNNKLKNHKVDWEKEDLLGGLEEALAQKKKSSRRLWIFLFLFLLMAGIASWGVHLANTNVDSTVLSTNIERTQNHNKNQTKEQKINTTAPIVESNFNEKTSNSTEPDQKGITKSNIVELGNPSIDSKSTNGAIESKEIIGTLTAKTNPKKNRSSDVLGLTEVIPVFKNSQKPLSNSNEAKNQSDVITKVDPTKDGDQQSLLLIEKTKEGRSKVDITNLSMLDAKVSLDHEVMINMEMADPIQAEKQEPRKVTFYIEPNVSIGLLKRKFGMPSSDVEGHLDEKRRLESPVLSDAISLEFGSLIKDKWFVQVGIEYQEMREKFEFNSVLNSDVTYIEYDKAFYYLNPEMDTTFIPGTRAVVTNTTRKIKHWNKHTYINIPLKIGRQFKIKNTTLHSSLGVSYAIKHTFRGRTKHYEKIIDDESYGFKNKVGLQFSIGGDYSLSDTKSLFLNVNFRKAPTLYFNEINEKSHFSYSLGAGVRFYLGQKPKL